MRTEKVSLTLDEALQLQHDRIAGLLADLEEEKGPIEKGVLEEVRKAWPSPEEGVGFTS